MSKPWAMLMHRRPQMLEARTTVGSCTEDPGPQYSTGSEGSSPISLCQAIPPQNLPLDTAQPQTCCCSGILQNHAALRLEHLATGERAGNGGWAGWLCQGQRYDHLRWANDLVPNNWSGRKGNPLQDHGDSGQRRALLWGLQRRWSEATRPPPPPAADVAPGLSQVGNRPRGPAEKRVASGGGRAPRRAVESQPRVFQGTRGTGARSASGGAAEGQPGAGSRWVPREAARRGPRGRREGAGRGRCGVPRTLQLPRKLARPAAGTGQRSASTAARGRCSALDQKTSQPLGAGARAEPRRVRPQGHLARRGKPSEGPSVRSGEGEAKCGQGACAV